MKNSIKRVILIHIAVLVFAVSMLTPFAHVNATHPYKHEEYIIPIQATSASNPFNALYSMIAVAGITPSWGMPLRWHTDEFISQMQGYPVEVTSGRSYTRVPFSTVRRVFNDISWWVNNGAEHWRREGNQINPPSFYQGAMGTLHELPVFQQYNQVGGGETLRFRVNVIADRGIQSVTINNNYFEIIHIDIRRIELHRNGIRVSNLDTTVGGQGNSSLIIIQMNSGGLYLSALYTTRAAVDGSYWNTGQRFFPNIRIQQEEISPPPSPIFLQPINIIDNTINIINIIKETTNICCDDCIVRIWIPDSPEDLRDRPITDIIRPRSGDNGGQCPIDPLYPCRCEPLDEDGFFTRFWDRFALNFGNLGYDHGYDDDGLSWWRQLLNWRPATPSWLDDLLDFNWPSLPGLGAISDTLGNIWNSISDFGTTISDALTDFFGGIFDIDDTTVWTWRDLTIDFSPITNVMPNFQEYFPFSLPFALYNTFRVVAGQAPMEVIGMTHEEAAQFMSSHAYMDISPQFSTQAPRIEIDIPHPFNYQFVFDMNDYQVMISVVRWSVLAMFAIGMFKMTPKLLKW